MLSSIKLEIVQILMGLKVASFTGLHLGPNRVMLKYKLMGLVSREEYHGQRRYFGWGEFSVSYEFVVKFRGAGGCQFDWLV
jgi:hypothetical protein